MKGFVPTMKYVTSCRHEDPATEPPPASMPSAFEGAHPHALVWLKNGGKLPYVTRNGVREGGLLHNTREIPETGGWAVDAGTRTQQRWGRMFL